MRQKREKSLVHSSHWFTGPHWCIQLRQWQEWLNSAAFRAKSHWGIGAYQWVLYTLDLYNKSHWCKPLPKGRRSTVPVTPPLGWASRWLRLRGFQQYRATRGCAGYFLKVRFAHSAPTAKTFKGYAKTFFTGELKHEKTAQKH
jgi:hypothetical protein